MFSQPTDDPETISSNSLLRTSCDLECLLIDDIRSLLGDKCDATTHASLLVLMNRLILNLRVLLDLSAKDGYLSVVLEKRPGLSRQIDALYQANLECVSSLVLIRDGLEYGLPVAAISKEPEMRLKKWIETFSAIRCRESTMLQEAFTVDIGGEA